jgi:hypothetical protein
MIVLLAFRVSTKDYWRCVDVLMGICRETMSSNGHVYTGWSPGVPVVSTKDYWRWSRDCEFQWSCVYWVVSGCACSVDKGLLALVERL